MNDLAGQTVVITGAAAGIGRAIAVKFAGARANVVVTDLEPPKDTVSAVESLGARCLAVVADVSNRVQAQEMTAAALRTFGSIDVLVCNATNGLLSEGVVTMSEETWDRVLGLNLKGAFLCVQAVLPALRDRARGSVVFVSTTTTDGAVSAAGAHYTCSRYGLIGLTRHLAIELGGTGIRVNCVCPGPIETPSLARIATTEWRREMERLTPLHRLGEVDDVADVVFFLAGLSAGHVHGAIFDIDGGLNLSDA
jgi:3-oxoacyl-[acyl-carrier protein] reductase